MGKVNIKTAMGNMESLNVLSAFKENNQTYVILDSTKMGSMGLPIIYVSKYTNKLENITDDNEWSAVKNYLRGIVNGTNFQYVNIPENVDADEAYYKPLTLPQASFDLIRSRYVVVNNNSTNEPVIAPTDTATITPGQNNDVSVPTQVTNEAPTIVPSVSPIIPDNSVSSNMNVGVAQANPVPTIEPQVIPDASVANNTVSVETANVVEPVIAPKADINNPFLTDKETFLKACENMFDALLAKYQKELANLEAREEELKKKEAEINVKMINANEALANAEAKEQVANIAHDNAQKVMDLQNFMPNNPNNNTGVI